jgi:serine/threonine protein kinase
VVVIKTLEKKKLKVHNITSRLKKDITIVRMISHPSIVAIIDVFATATKVFVVQEYVQGSMILEMLHEKGNNLCSYRYKTATFMGSYS